MTKLLLPFLALALQTPAAGPETPESSASPPSEERWIRLVEEGSELHLELALRTFAPRSDAAGGPRVVLAAAMHIAEPGYYAALQERLDALDRVLFEGVKPPGTGDPEHDVVELTDEVRVGITRGRIRFVAGAVHRYRALHEAWPEDVEELVAGLPRDVAELARGAVVDAWGRPLQLAAAPERTRRPFDVQSLGADGAIGGTGADADLCFADQDELEGVERGEGGGIQQDLAEALGLVFQLDAMDHSGPQWRNSDLSIDQIEARLLGTEVDSESLFSSLRGTSFVAKAAGFALKLLARTSYGSAAMKVLGLEVLSRADELLEAAPGMEELMEVLIVERNRVVIGDLRRELEELPADAVVGVIYGAGHLRDLEARLGDELGYARTGEEWVRAVTVDVEDLGIDPGEVRWMRTMVRTALERELGRRR